ncbi:MULTISPECIES: hypothetical protein [Arsenophonus]|uniref:hypothetical protein n=1 Tax=Arsenophonus TaxID=637 RepID=UPI000ABCE594|nr:hypothetical protein [Candidatus Arsenophonus lipoptenae]
MFNDINLSLFKFINANPMTSSNILGIATFFAKKLIFIFPSITIISWIWGPSKNLSYQRIFVCKTTFSLIIVICSVISGFISILFPQERPFILGIGQQFLYHDPTPSFPSNHATIAFTFTLSFFFGLK